MQNLILHIDGMTCQGCANSVHKALSAVAGVHDVKVDWALKRAEVLVDAAQAGVAALIEAVENAGFDARAA